MRAGFLYCVVRRSVSAHTRFCQQHCMYYTTTTYCYIVRIDKSHSHIQEEESDPFFRKEEAAK